MSELNKIRRFGIYHPQDGGINATCLLADYSYEYITTVEAENVVKAFYKAQSKFNLEYKKLGKRDTLAGDLITSNDKLYMFNGTGGFKRVPTTKALYKEVMEIDEAIIEILSRRHLSQEDLDEIIDNCY